MTTMTNSQKTVFGVSLCIYIFFFGVIWSFFNQQFFIKQLGTEEQKYTLFSENAFYYSFYQDLTEAKNLPDFHAILLSNGQVEAPLIIKPIVSFNLAPEIIVATLYRPIQVLLPQLSPFNFYMLFVFGINALVFPLLYLTTITIYKTKKFFQIGAIVTLFAFLNLNYLTRSFTYPALRENFALPFLIILILLIAKYNDIPKKYSNYLLAGVTLINLLFWQFSFFTLLPIVSIALFIFRPSTHLKYLALSILVLLFIRSGSFTHVFEFVQDKISYKPDFDSLIYSCERAFNPPTIYMIQTLIKKLVLPLYFFSLLFLGYQYQFKGKKLTTGHIFLVLISLIFLIYCINSNRFFVLFLPFAVITAIYPFTQMPDEYFLIAFAILGVSLIQNSPNLTLNQSKPNFSDKISLTNWINKNTSPDDVFTGTMQTTSFVRLLTGRRITNHPQYETKSNRQTTKDTYLVYTHTTPEKIHEIMTHHHTKYLILDESSCFSSTSMGCFIEDLYQDQGYDLKASRLFCEIDFSTSKLFTPVYTTPTYIVLKVL
jgi:hypothetical protein